MLRRASVLLVWALVACAPSGPRRAPEPTRPHAVACASFDKRLGVRDLKLTLADAPGLRNELRGARDVLAVRVDAVACGLRVELIRTCRGPGALQPVNGASRTTRVRFSDLALLRSPRRSADAVAYGEIVAERGIGDVDVWGTELTGVGCDRATHFVSGYARGNLSLTVRSEVREQVSDAPVEVTLRRLQDPLEPCPPGKTHSEGQCVVDKACPSDERQVGQQCVPILVCPPGSSTGVRGCEGPAPRCPPSYQRQSKRCVAGPVASVIKPTPNEVVFSAQGARPAFYLDRMEVTVDAYRDCVQAGVCGLSRLRPVGEESYSEHLFNSAECNYGRAGRGDHPMNCVAYTDAATYCRYRAARLPMPAEWRRAATGLAMGDACSRAVENVCAEGGCVGQSKSAPTPGCGRGTTWPTGAKAAGATRAGVMNMAGNVSEWVGGAKPQIFGGNWLKRASVSASVGGWNEEVDAAVGFRCARLARSCPPGGTWTGERCEASPICGDGQQVRGGSCVAEGRRLVMSNGTVPSFYVDTRYQGVGASWADAASHCAEAGEALPSRHQHRWMVRDDSASSSSTEWLADRGTLSSYQELTPNGSPGAFALASDGELRTPFDRFPNVRFRCVRPVASAPTVQVAPLWTRDALDAFCQTSFSCRVLPMVGVPPCAATGH